MIDEAGCWVKFVVNKVTFATNWKAQAAHGSFYQTLADGT